MHSTSHYPDDDICQRDDRTDKVTQTRLPPPPLHPSLVHIVVGEGGVSLRAGTPPPRLDDLWAANFMSTLVNKNIIMITNLGLLLMVSQY